VSNKGIDAINISNILNRKEVVKEIPPYFKNQSVPIVSYSYINSIGRKIFNYKEAYIQITSDYMSRWVVLKRRVGAVTSQRVLNVLFYANILQCFFVVEHLYFSNQFHLNLFMITI
jgi:hypothetical protein